MSGTPYGQYGGLAELSTAGPRRHQPSSQHTRTHDREVCSGRLPDPINPAFSQLPLQHNGNED
eukprot:8780605-Pyramimonas_sp.AAC.1